MAERGTRRRAFMGQWVLIPQDALGTRTVLVMDCAVTISPVGLYQASIATPISTSEILYTCDLCFDRHNFIISLCFPNSRASTGSCVWWRVGVARCGIFRIPLGITKHDQLSILCPRFTYWDASSSSSLLSSTTPKPTLTFGTNLRAVSPFMGSSWTSPAASCPLVSCSSMPH